MANDTGAGGTCTQFWTASSTSVANVFGGTFNSNGQTTTQVVTFSGSAIGSFIGAHRSGPVNALYNSAYTGGVVQLSAEDSGIIQGQNSAVSKPPTYTRVLAVKRTSVL